MNSALRFICKVVRLCLLILAVLVPAACSMSGVPPATEAQAPAAKPPIAPELTKELEKQKAAMSRMYVESSSSSEGTLRNWDYTVAPVTVGYFDGPHIYWQEQTL